MAYGCVKWWFFAALSYFQYRNSFGCNNMGYNFWPTQIDSFSFQGNSINRLSLAIYLCIACLGPFTNNKNHLGGINFSSLQHSTQKEPCCHFISFIYCSPVDESLVSVAPDVTCARSTTIHISMYCFFRARPDSLTGFFAAITFFWCVSIALWSISICELGSMLTSEVNPFSTNRHQ